MNRENDQLIAGHEYDGIQEFDNPLPGWWLWTFFGTIIFAFLYYVHYEIAGGPTTRQELAASMQQIQALKKNGPVFNEEKLAALFTANAVKEGHEIFTGKCAACHGPEGGGLIGPNLTDKSWIHGKGSRLDIMTVVAQGVADKGMPPWAEQLSEKDLVSVVSFVYSIKGTFVSGGKPPQGTEVP